MRKYVATIYFECSGKTNPNKAIQIAAVHLENYSPDLQVLDVHVEEDEP
jgi:hypothetical protein